MNVYIGISLDDAYLLHYGRQGMHWYQHIFGDDPRWGSHGRGKVLDDDGRFSRRGYEILDEINEKAWREYHDYYVTSLRRYAAPYGIEVSDSKTGDDTIEAGSEIRRLTDNPNETMDRRKYASLTDDDLSTYEEDWAGIGLDMHKEPYIARYVATKKMKVAGTNVITDKLYSYLSDIKIADLPAGILKRVGPDVLGYEASKDPKAVKKFVDNFNKQFADKRIGDYPNLWFMNRYADMCSHDETSKYPTDFVRTFQTMANIQDSLYDAALLGQLPGVDVYSKLEAEGYDAVVDPMDGGGLYVDYPIVVLNPEKSMKLKRVSKMFDEF